jgi:hypothetical protein
MKKIIKTSLVAFIFTLVSANVFSTKVSGVCGWSLRPHSTTFDPFRDTPILPAGITCQPVSTQESAPQNLNQRPMGWSLRPVSNSVNVYWSWMILFTTPGTF